MSPHSLIVHIFQVIHPIFPELPQNLGMGLSFASMSESESVSLKWNQLQSFPFIRFSQPSFINDDEFVVCSWKDDNQCQGDGIYKFNIIKSEWIKIMDYNEEFKCKPVSTVYDRDNNVIYMMDLVSHNHGYVIASSI